MNGSSNVAGIHVAGYSTDGTASHPVRPEPVNHLIAKISLTGYYNWQLSVYDEVADEIRVDATLKSSFNGLHSKATHYFRNFTNWK